MTTAGRNQHVQPFGERIRTSANKAIKTVRIDKEINISFSIEKKVHIVFFCPALLL